MGCNINSKSLSSCKWEFRIRLRVKVKRFRGMNQGSVFKLQGSGFEVQSVRFGSVGRSDGIPAVEVVGLGCHLKCLGRSN